MSAAAEIMRAERGEYRILDDAIMRADPDALLAFQAQIQGEARRRGLELSIEFDVMTQDVIVRWRPERRP